VARCLSPRPASSASELPRKRHLRLEGHEPLLLNGGADPVLVALRYAPGRTICLVWMGLSGLALAGLG
jgi:hypothetical protein